MPEHIFHKIALYLYHPIADIFNERFSCLIGRIKDIPELTFHRLYFYTRCYPTLFAYIKNKPTNNQTKHICFFLRFTA
jgi:hypothetical protein